CHSGCAEVDSMTEAVVGKGFRLGCISCKRREEVSAQATVDWHYKPPGMEEFWHIFHYDHPNSDVLHENFSNRIEWHGTLGSDVQTATIYIHNITYNDIGTYRCTIHRTLHLPRYDEEVTVEKQVELNVVAVANPELTTVVSEIMMYVLIVVLQLWLIVILVYCYKKILKEHEEREGLKDLK
uniref:Sodium channel regulatory subunit beta-3 n=1 Tax=Tetraodon nigroviridis TaxID=99883 RepID=H3CL45_TETNG